MRQQRRPPERTHARDVEGAQRAVRSMEESDGGYAPELLRYTGRYADLPGAGAARSRPPTGMRAVRSAGTDLRDGAPRADLRSCTLCRELAHRGSHLGSARRPRNVHAVPSTGGGPSRRLTPPSSGAEGMERKCSQRGVPVPPLLSSAAQLCPALCRLQRTC